MGNVIQLAADAVDAATVEALTRLLEAAQTGQIVGLAYVALHAGPDFTADIVGHCRDHPLLCRGIASALGDTVAEFCRK